MEEKVISIMRYDDGRVTTAVIRRSDVGFKFDKEDGTCESIPKAKATKKELIVLLEAVLRDLKISREDKIAAIKDRDSYKSAIESYAKHKKAMEEILANKSYRLDLALKTIKPLMKLVFIENK